ncbi:MAG: hypothetical protein HYX48_05645 [Chlamydiales bacterium]|nr:hypothetical protein [Chlamydiales bacterium]
MTRTYPNKMPYEISEDFETNLLNFSEGSIGETTAEEKVRRFGQNGRNIDGNFIRIGSDTQELYSMGYGCYLAGNFEQADALFSSLVLANPYEERSWRGLASTKQMKGSYHEALRAWSLVALLAENDPMPHFHAAECLTSLKEHTDALKALNMSERLLKEEASELKTKIELLRRANGQ